MLGPQIRLLTVGSRSIVFLCYAWQRKATRACSAAMTAWQVFCFCGNSYCVFHLDHDRRGMGGACGRLLVPTEVKNCDRGYIHRKHYVNVEAVNSEGEVMSTTRRFLGAGSTAVAAAAAARSFLARRCGLRFRVLALPPAVRVDRPSGGGAVRMTVNSTS